MTGPATGECNACWLYQHHQCEQPLTCVCCGSARPALAALIALPSSAAAKPERGAA